MGRKGWTVMPGKGLKWAWILVLTLALPGFGDPPETEGGTARGGDLLPFVTRMVWTEGAKPAELSEDTPGAVAVEEDVSVVIAPMGAKSVEVAVPDIGAAPLGQEMKSQEATVRPFRSLLLDRALPEPWDVGPVPVVRGSPAARLRNAADTEENPEEAARLRMEYWETVNTAVQRRELFERLAAEEATKRRPQGNE